MTVFLSITIYFFISLLIAILLAVPLFRKQGQGPILISSKRPHYTKKMAIKIAVISFLFIVAIPMIGHFVSAYREPTSYLTLVLIISIIIAFAFSLFNVQNSENDE